MPNDCPKPKSFLRYLFLIVLSSGLLTQTFAQNSITGKLIDSVNNTPVSGATVNVLGSTVTVKTGNDGEFTIAAKLNETLSFTHVGYSPITVTVETYAPLVVNIAPESKELSDIVVVGYGRQKKVSVVAAISTMKATGLLQTPASNIGIALAGRLPGSRS